MMGIVVMTIPGIFTSGNELQKLGDDSTYPAVSADHLLGEESLFNDSLDDVHVHEKAIRAALTDMEKTADNEREHSLEDSLDYDMTQLHVPFDDVDNDSGLNTNLIGRGSGNQGDVVNSKSMSGFQVAVQIPVSLTCDDGGTSEVTDSKSNEMEVRKVKDTTEDHHEKIPHDQRQMEKSTHTSSATSTVRNSLNAACSDSSVSKSLKLVPSFGRRKNKTALSPPTQVDTKEERDKKTSSVAGGCQATEKEDTSSEETLQEGDQCVPETTVSVENPSNTFAGNYTGKNKQNATSGEREQNMKELGQNIPSTSAISKKEKKLTAKQEQKKQEKEEKRREAERKKLEREKKKKIAEERKAEKERLKKEHQLELERKRAEREQKKIQQVLKKAECKDGKQSSKKTAKKANKENGGLNGEIIAESAPVSQSKSKGDTTPHSMSATKLDIEMEDTVQSNGNKNIDESMQTECGGVTRPEENASLPDTSKSLQPCCESLGMNRAEREGEKEQSTADLPLESADMGEGCSMAREDLGEVEQREGNGEALDDDREPASHDKENDGQNAQEIKPQSEKIKIVFGPTSKNTQKKTDSLRANSLTDGGDVSKPKTAVNIGIMKSTPKAVFAAKPKKTPGKTPGSAAAKKKLVSKGTSSTTSNPKATKSKQMKRACPQDSDVKPESKRSKPANYTGPVWVQCERPSCKKWRQLRDCTDPLSLPESWNCTMNTGNQWSEPCACTPCTYIHVCNYIHVHACVYYVGVYASFLEAFHVYHTVNVCVMLSAYQAIYTKYNFGFT